ncbi:MAG: sugar phosphate isomerase/epimerase [Armatimonadetes bacterium]|jgi:sugar phosphate isomerase/epimerase|nr:sugar phosphate isomerase/epimerase [Armatimonadota bacterium]
MKPISLQLYTVRDEAAKDFPGVLRRVAEIGYKGVEFAGLHGMAPAEVRKIIDDLGLQVSSAHMAMPTAENRQQLIDECQTLGNTRLISGFGPDQFKTLDDCKAAAEQVAKAAALLEGSGIAFGLHNHWWEFEPVAGVLPEDILLASTPSVFAEIDVYWAAVGGVDPAVAVAQRKSRAPVLHIKDGPIEPKQPHTAVGAGALNIPAIIQAADPDVLQWVIVELDSYAGDMMEAVEASYRYLTQNGLAVGNK